MTLIAAMLILTGLGTPPPIMQAEDTMGRGATVMYTISMEEGLDY